MPFYYAGGIMKLYRVMEHDSKLSQTPLWVLIVAFAISLLCSKINGAVNLTTCDIGKNYCFFLISGGLGSICLFEFLNRTASKSVRFVENISNGTLLIMSVHYLMIKPLKLLTPSDGIVIWLFDSVIIILITYILILISKKYCPILIGKYKLFK